MIRIHVKAQNSLCCLCSAFIFGSRNNDLLHLCLSTVQQKTHRIQRIEHCCIFVIQNPESNLQTRHHTACLCGPGTLILVPNMTKKWKWATLMGHIKWQRDKTFWKHGECDGPEQFEDRVMSSCCCLAVSSVFRLEGRCMIVACYPVLQCFRLDDHRHQHQPRHFKWRNCHCSARFRVLLGVSL